MKVVIVGAGHAGVAAAQSAAEEGAEVLLYSKESALPYYRPRLVEYAFEGGDFSRFYLHPEEWYQEKGITLFRENPVTGYSADGRHLITQNDEIGFDACVIAAGAGPVLPPFLRSVKSAVPLWDKKDAETIYRCAGKGGRVIVLGGGILGIEVALRARKTGLEACVIERMNRLMPAQFEEEGSNAIRYLLESTGVETRIGQSVTAANDVDGESGVSVILDSGEELRGCVLVVAIGGCRDLSLFKEANFQTEQGLVVDQHLRTSRESYYACGDLVQYQGVSRYSVQEAVGQGRIAGFNAAAGLRGDSFKEYSPSEAPVSFKLDEFDIFSAGEIRSKEDKVHLLSDLRDKVYKSVVTREGRVVGLQMVGDRSGFQKYLKMIKEKSSYADPEEK